MTDLNKIELAGQTPGQLADIKLSLVDYYSKLGDRKVELMELRALYYDSFRVELKSDLALERKWERTIEGLEYLKTKQIMASLEHKIASINSSLYVANRESRNGY